MGQKSKSTGFFLPKCAG